VVIVANRDFVAASLSAPHVALYANGRLLRDRVAEPADVYLSVPVTKAALGAIQ
jgi:hypothetical protein